MGGTSAPLKGPDLLQGVPESDVVQGKPLLGHANGEAVLLVREGEQLNAIGATCSHYGGPLAEGIQVGSTVRCPWHHARFDVRTGQAVAAPALNPLTCYRVERKDGRARVLGKEERFQATTRPGPSSVVIVGGGAAGEAAAEMLRTEGYPGPITIYSADENGPCDRPNLSKDYLAGTAPEEWIPLRGADFYAEKQIALKTGTRVQRLLPDRHELQLSDGTSASYGALLLATGAEAIPLSVPGADLPHVFVLRSLNDCRKIIRAATAAKRAVVVGSSFLGMEVAASLRTRGLEVTVVTSAAHPFARVLGAEVGELFRELHASHGVQFRFRTKIARIEAGAVTLEDGARLPADLVVAGIGVRPSLELAEKAGLRVDGGVVVNALLETSAKDVWAAGDIARWPDPRAGSIRVEHWVVAERQGQTAARNMLGKREPFTFAPFFWTTQYDLTLTYVGFGEGFEGTRIDGDLRRRDAAIRYLKGSKTVALATLNRDVQSLTTEARMEELQARFRD